MDLMMNFQPSRPTLFAAVAAVALAATSCSSTTTAPPSVYLTSTLGESVNATMSQICNVDEPDAPFWNVGTPGVPVITGTSPDGGGGAVSVSCEVHATGDGAFDVNLVVNQGENFGITVGGTLSDKPGVSQGPLAVNFNKFESGNYNETDCTMVLSTQGNPPITAGRIWGTVTCPTLADPGNSVTCAATATFIFQNCDE